MDSTLTENLVENPIEYAEDFPGNMPCDYSGFCAGTTCSQFFICHSKEEQK